VAGLCFGLGYGVVQRLMRLELPRGGLLAESFRMREFPGTTLNSLRLRLGEEPASIRGDLGALEREEQQRKAEAERRKREQELEAERQRQKLEDPLSRELEPAAATVPPPEPVALPEPLPASRPLAEPSPPTDAPLPVRPGLPAP
jgi:hypothetical protein